MSHRAHPLRRFVLLYAALAGAATAALVWRLGWHALVAWLVAANLVAVPIWAWDKRQARKGGARVPENALHVFAFTGATPASFLAMRWLRHKTLKPRFRWLYAGFLALQVAGLVWWWRTR